MISNVIVILCVIILFAIGNRNRDHTTKIGDSKGCLRCCVGK